METFPEVEAVAPRWTDNRGWLQVLYESPNMVLKRSFSLAGVFRGLHLQVSPSPQLKIIRVVEGRIRDFVADPEDPERRIHSTELQPSNGWVRIDPQFAHGFYALEDTLFEYICEGGYDESSEKAFSINEYLEEQLGFTNLIVSDKDRASPPLWG